ncbi:hypothetical protein LTR84_011314 [Exophiala bonariae]|uniref:Uncharacterized protein n=1 Tax=Exophiala bonariae TaxID=1690606 RepID=A0AAV9MRZ0_9EURO|nr:hypothetical protein LTR84_011314 [Exophiala bonariae]
MCHVLTRGGTTAAHVFYFVVPNDDVVVNTLLKESSVLRKAGVKKWFEGGDAPTSKERVNNRVKVTRQKALFQDGDDKLIKVEQKIDTVTATCFK